MYSLYCECGFLQWPLPSPPGMSTSTPLMQTGPGQSWDHEYLNPAQFAQLVELFLGRDSSL